VTSPRSRATLTTDTSRFWRAIDLLLLMVTFSYADQVAVGAHNTLPATWSPSPASRLLESRRDVRMWLDKRDKTGHVRTMSGLS
jgi:hypothetical protein